MPYRGRSLVCRDRRRVEFNVEAKVTLVVHLYSSLHLNLGYIYLNHQRTKICELSHFLKVKGANIIVLSFPFVHLLPECSTLLQSWNSFPLAFVNHPASLQISVTHCIFNLLSFAHQPTQCTSLPSSSPLPQVYSLIWDIEPFKCLVHTSTREKKYAPVILMRSLSSFLKIGNIADFFQSSGKTSSSHMIKIRSRNFLTSSSPQVSSPDR